MEHPVYSTAAYTSETGYPKKQWRDSLLHYLARCGHPFVLNNSELPQITFPKLALLDGQSEIHLALFARNAEGTQPKFYVGACGSCPILP